MRASLWLNKDCQCVRLIRNKMHTVSLFGHFETSDRVAFKWEGCSKCIQNDSNQIQIKLHTLPPPSPLPSDSGRLSSSIWNSRAWWKVISLNGILRKLLGEYMLSLHMEMNKCAYQFPKEKIALQPRLGLEPVGVWRLTCSIPGHPIFSPGKRLLVNFGLFL